MNIGDKYSENKLYRGIKYGNGLPLLSEDLEEFSDTLADKNRHLLGSILGSGLLKDLDLYYTSQGIGIQSPAVLNIEGDICLVCNSQDTYLSDISEMYSESDPESLEGIVCIVGWYQHIIHDTTLKEFGGVRNKDLPNDLVYDKLKIQVSSRYQFRWDTIVVKSDDMSKVSQIEIPVRDHNGALTGTTKSILTRDLIPLDSIYYVDHPSDLTYMKDKLYIIPFIKYRISAEDKEISYVNNVEIRRTNSSNDLINSTTEPTGNIAEGTVWYNPDTSEFKTYVAGLGFVENSPRIGLLRYQYVDIASSDIDVAANLDYTMDFPSISGNDVINVTYEGLLLEEGTDYSINRETSSITLLNFTRKSGEKLLVTLTKLVNTSQVSTVTSSLTDHINSYGSGGAYGHVRLSDDINSDSDASASIAATPKAVKESRILRDIVTGNNYELGIENGVLYIKNNVTSEKTVILSGIS